MLNNLRYNGFAPSSTPVIQRQWPDYNPTLSASDFKVRCNGGTSAGLSASVKPGDSIQAIWQQWTHSQGPIMVWMYVKKPGKEEKKRRTKKKDFLKFNFPRPFH